MKPIFYICCVAALLYLQSCGGGLIKHKGDSDQTSGGSSRIPIPVATDNLIVNDEKDLTGYWVGEFGPDVADSDRDNYGDNAEFNTINISIDEINDDAVNGHTVIAGKVRFFKCKMTETGSKYQFKFKGGADEKANGTYKFGITKGDSVINGRWDAGANSSARYKLTKHFFNYNPNWKLTEEKYVDQDKSTTVTIKGDSGETYQNSKYFSTSDEVTKRNASAELLTKDYVANLKKADFLVLRNSIFARHGYTFKKPLLSAYFSQQPWYIPISDDVTAQLTDIEKKNIALMVPYEKNAEAYYGVFGR